MVGNLIKQIREQKGYSITELADKAGVSKSYLSYIERGIQQNPSLQVLSRLAKTLDTNVESLLHHEDKKNLLKTTSIDEEWVSLIQDAIHQGVTKDELSYYLDFVKFRKDNGGNS
ncbi:helix-turn-helix domain-containing protein [Peribacillus alkalitolerans]|uniref:helix-turn-helix domain-containing protein n=1 Tax=Peribacillus alkalitolerans TaxID=1550385 RepID=UPI0013D65335|nr:helix-turn-helix transcriptional regulator [Peribacillus alkalitolerans]